MRKITISMTALSALSALSVLCCLGALAPASAQSRPARPATAQPATAQPLTAQPAAPEAADPQDGDDRGGAGYLPGAQFQRKLDGGPGFVCTATNARHTDQCTASCRVGETADCVDADGAGAPSCGCTKG